MRFKLFLISLLCLLLTGTDFSIGERGMVVSAHRYASEVGAEIIKNGGNAFDAAVAVGFALQSVYPSAGNIAGGGFAVFRTANGDIKTLDFRETAPQSSHRDMYIIDGKGDTKLSQKGGLAVGVPGTVKGLAELHRIYGKLSWKDVVTPSVLLAKSHILTPRSAAFLNGMKDSLSIFPATKKVYVRDENWKSGDSFSQPDLANTLQRIADQGPEEFYIGETAKLMVSSIQTHGGIMTMEDLASYQVKWRDPLHITYRGLDVYTMGLPSSGGIILAQTLNALEGKVVKESDKDSPEFWHFVSSIWQHAFADRAHFMGDPDRVIVPMDTLISKPYIVNRLKNFDPTKKIPSDKVSYGKFKLPKEKEETTHFSVMDSDGNMVSITYTLNGAAGSLLVAEGTGFLLNNEMDDFSIQPGVANLYGLIGGEANSIQPGKRMLSSMTPTIVLMNQKPFLILGSPGGSTIPTTVAQVLINIIDFGMSPSEAVKQGRIHYQWWPDHLFLEKDFWTEEMKSEMQTIGYPIEIRKTSQGRCEVIMIRKSRIIGVPDPRGEDFASGVK